MLWEFSDDTAVSGINYTRRKFLFVQFLKCLLICGAGDGDSINT